MTGKGKSIPVPPPSLFPLSLSSSSSLSLLARRLLASRKPLRFLPHTAGVGRGWGRQAQTLVPLFMRGAVAWIRLMVARMGHGNGLESHWGGVVWCPGLGTCVHRAARPREQEIQVLAQARTERWRSWDDRWGRSFPETSRERPERKQACTWAQLSSERHRELDSRTGRKKERENEGVGGTRPGQGASLLPLVL